MSSYERVTRAKLINQDGTINAMAVALVYDASAEANLIKVNSQYFVAVPVKGKKELVYCECTDTGFPEEFIGNLHDLYHQLRHFAREDSEVEIVPPKKRNPT